MAISVTIRKLVHACLIVDVDGYRALIDPGIHTWQSDVFRIDDVGRLDRILITHEHADHLSVDFVRALVEGRPDLVVETVPPVAAILDVEGIPAVEATEATSPVARFTAPHEVTPLGQAPVNTGFHLAGVFSHPGDSHSFEETSPVLALALMPPWGSLTGAVAAAKRVGPRYVVPVHDWYVSPAGRRWTAGMAERAFEGLGIELVFLDEFETVDLRVDETG